MQAALGELQCHVILASSTAELLQVAAERWVAAIVLDIQSADDFETVDALSRIERARETPIILLASPGDLQSVARACKLGKVDFLYKPLLPELLSAKVASLIAAETERQRLQADVRRLTEEFRQFAYVASHDLQEPLRTVASYAQLLARRYRGKLDTDADDFIRYMVSGVTRMHELLNDMLSYARITDARNKPLVRVELSEALRTAIQNLQAEIDSSGAEVIKSPLPAVTGDPGQLTQLFQHLIANAIQFKGSETPRVHVSAEERDSAWIISVRDNGIGIDPQYSERIFGIFKRLHGRELPGTGMGLAICKRIVERHNGRIWVESAGGAGSDFRFALPVIPPESAVAEVHQPT